MVTLQSRWKQNRSWNVRLYIGLLVAAVLCVVVVFAVKGLVGWVKDVVVPAAIPHVVSSPAEPDPNDQFRGEMVSASEREFRVSDYTLVLPNDFELDVLPQPGDMPHGDRFTGVRYRVGRDDAAQLFVIVIDRPKAAAEERETEPDLEKRTEAALERLFARITRNAATVRLARGDTEYGDLDGLSFARCDFSGDVKNGRRAARVRCLGSALATIDEDRDVFVYSLCESTAHRDDRDLMDSSVLTLRRAGSVRRRQADETPSEESAEEE